MRAALHAGEPGPRDPSEEVFLAFARVFSGVVRDGQRVHVLSAAYDPAHPQQERQELQVPGVTPGRPSPFLFLPQESFVACVLNLPCQALALRSGRQQLVLARRIGHKSDHEVATLACGSSHASRQVA